MCLLPVTSSKVLSCLFQNEAINARKAVVINTKLEEDENKGVNRRHIYAEVIILNNKKDNCHNDINEEISCIVMKTCSISSESQQCQSGDHDDHFCKL